MPCAQQPLLRPAMATRSVGSDLDWKRKRRDEGEDDLLDALRRGDESAFSRLFDLHHASMIRVARLYVESTSVAEQVAQAAWLGVVQGLGRFRGRCTVKAWIFAIVSNLRRDSAP